MTPPTKSRLLRSLTLIAVAVMALLGGVDRLERTILPEPLSAASQRVLEANLVQAASLFAVARIVDGAISVAQTAEISVGIGIQPGQILDPVNDLVERFSSAMLGASIMLGGAVLLIRTGDLLGLPVLLPLGLLVIVASLWLPGGLSILTRRLGGFILFAALVLKIVVPLMVLGAASLAAVLLDPTITEAKQRLDALSLLGSSMNLMGGGGGTGFFDRLPAMSDITGTVMRFMSSLGDLSDILIDLCTAYIAKILLLPLLLFWLLGRMAEMLASSLAAPPLVTNS